MRIESLQAFTGAQSISNKNSPSSFAWLDAISIDSYVSYRIGVAGLFNFVYVDILAWF